MFTRDHAAEMNEVVITLLRRVKIVIIGNRDHAAETSDSRETSESRDHAAKLNASRDHAAKLNASRDHAAEMRENRDHAAKMSEKLCQTPDENAGVNVNK